MDPEKREFGKWWVWVSVLAFGTLAVLMVLGYAGLFGRTVVERKVFEESFQYGEARKAEIATYEAQLAGMRARLLDQNLKPETRADVQAQIAAVEMQLAAARKREAE